MTRTPSLGGLLMPAGGGNPDERRRRCSDTRESTGYLQMRIPPEGLESRLGASLLQQERDGHSSAIPLSSFQLRSCLRHVRPS